MEHNNDNGKDQYQQLIIKQRIGSPAVTYPDSLEPTISHDDFGSMTSQLSSLSSLTVSQPQLNSNSNNNTSSSDGSQRDIITATTSTATDISEWCDPDTDTELYVMATDTKTDERRDTTNKEELLMEDQRIIQEKTDEAINSVVRRWSIMYGPEGDSSSSDDGSITDSSSSSISYDEDNDGMMLDQSSTLTTTTSHTTVFALEDQPQQKDEEPVGGKLYSSNQSIGAAIAQCNSNQEYQRIFRKEHNDDEDPPISHMLSEALKEIEGTEMSELEDEGQYNNVKEDDHHSIDGPTVAIVTATNNHMGTNAAAGIAIHEPVTGRHLQGNQPLQEENTSDVNPSTQKGIHTSIVSQVTPLLLQNTGSNTNSSPSKSSKHSNSLMTTTTSVPVDRVLPLVTAINIEDNILTSSDIALDVMVSNSSDDLLKTSSEDITALSSQQSLEESMLSDSNHTCWELPVQASLDDKLRFIMEKINLLQYYHKTVIQHIIEEREMRSKEMRECINVVKSMEKDQEQEHKKQRDRIELIESAVVELGRNHNGHHRMNKTLPLERRGSTKVSYQKAEKLKSFFGAQPPLIDQFLKDLGYEEYIPRFRNERIGLDELPHLQEQNLITLGIPLGPRIRIMYEAKQL